jgi:hypothetical protein
MSRLELTANVFGGVGGGSRGGIGLVPGGCCDVTGSGFARLIGLPFLRLARRGNNGSSRNAVDSVTPRRRDEETGATLTLFLIVAQSDRDIDLMTAIFAGPEMIDCALTYVPRFFWGKQYVSAFSAGHSVARAIVIPGKGHDAFPVFLCFPSWRRKLKKI